MATVQSGIVIDSPFIIVYGRGVVIVLGESVQNGVEIVLNSPVVAQNGAVIPCGLGVTVQRGVEIKYDIRDFDLVERGVVISYPLRGDTALIVNFIPKAVVNGRDIYLMSCSISLDDGQYAWTCDMSLMYPADYALFFEGVEFTITLPGEAYLFVFDGKGINRSSQIAIDMTVQGIGPAAKYAEPRHLPLTQTFNGYTDEIAAALTAGHALTWEILRWTLPKYDVSGEAPIRILQNIAKAAGGVVVSDPGGELRVRYDFPVSVPLYGADTKDITYDDISHNFTLSQNVVLSELVDRLRLLDAAAGSNNDAIEFIQDEEKPNRGRLKVIPRPWRTSIVVTHSSDSNVSITAQGLKSERLTETIEIIGGRATTSKNIDAQVAFQYLFRNLGAITFTPGTNELSSAIAGESLITYTYDSNYLQYDVTAKVGYKVQFLSNEFGITDEASRVDVTVRRGAGTHPGGDIVDPLMTARAVALQRGRNEVDARSSGMQDVDASTIFRAGVRTGKIAEFYDSLTGEIWYGKITGITHSVQRAGNGHFEISTELAVQRPTNFIGA